MPGMITKMKPFFPADGNIDDRTHRLPYNKFWQFDKSLNVAVTGMRILGIPFDVSSIRSPYLHFWSIWFGRFFFLINVSINIIVSMRVIDDNGSVRTTSDWSYLISELNYSVGLVVTNIALLIRLVPNWKKFVQVLHRIEKLGLFQEIHYEMFRRYFFIGSCAFLLLVIIYYITK